MEGSNDVVVSIRDDECPPYHMHVCVSGRCVCVPDFNHPGQPPTPIAQCTATVGYAAGRPDLPWLQFSSGDCGMNAEIALAVALASLLKSSGLTIPMPK